MTEEEKRKQAAAVEQGQQAAAVTHTPSAQDGGSQGYNWKPENYWVQGQNGVEKVSDSDDGLSRIVMEGGNNKIYVNEAQPDGSRKTRYVGVKTTEPASSQQSAVSSQQSDTETLETLEVTPTAAADDALDELERENEERRRKGKEIYESMFRPTETEAERNQREKREKTLRTVAGIHDMTRALANLFGTVRYAPSWYDGNNLSDKARERYERAKTEREKDKAYNDNLRMVLNKLEGDYNNMKLKIEAEKARRAEAAANRAMRERLAKATAKAKADEGDKNRENKKEVAETNAKAKVRAAAVRGSSGGSGKQLTFYSPGGKSVEAPKEDGSGKLATLMSKLPGKYREFKGADEMVRNFNAFMGDENYDINQRRKFWNELLQVIGKSRTKKSAAQTQPKPAATTNKRKSKRQL